MNTPFFLPFLYGTVPKGTLQEDTGKTAIGEGAGECRADYFIRIRSMNCSTFSGVTSLKSIQ